MSPKAGAKSQGKNAGPNTRDGAASASSGSAPSLPSAAGSPTSSVEVGGLLQSVFKEVGAAITLAMRPLAEQLQIMAQSQNLTFEVLRQGQQAMQEQHAEVMSVLRTSMVLPPTYSMATPRTTFPDADPEEDGTVVEELETWARPGLEH